ncbi:MAG TPA: Ig-like domain-containing protein [Albitalea sp.]|uniref:Ig-like domain-containing protein n=1 Tax=Piscinibacter sp. TaxID=1903157 RepID=UPI002ED5B945
MRVVRIVVGSLLLSGCGGGVFIGFGNFDDRPPVVSLTTASTSVGAGQPVRFAAAATDENGIDQVSFYRVDANGAVLLGSDRSEPYELTVTAPVDGRASLAVFARAFDDSGNSADSATVTVAVVP